MQLTHDMVRRAHLLDDDVLEKLPLIETLDFPVASPQEYECGCVAVQHIRGRRENAFEMRLAISCTSRIRCEVLSRRACPHDLELRIHPMGGGVWVCFACWVGALFGAR